MQLMLSVQETPRLLGVHPIYEMTDGSVIIGREATADWHLPDSERILSKTHCRIDALASGFIITDLSTNGVFINGERVGYEQSRQLSDDDRLCLGDVDIAVTIRADEARSDSNELLDAFPPQGPFGNDKPNTDASAVDESPTLNSPVPSDAVSTPGDRPNKPAIAATNAIVMGLVRTFPNLDAAQLALAIDAAGAEIPEAEWQAFYHRLLVFLYERYSHE